MAKLENDPESLRREAERLYREYGETRAAYRRDRSNPALQGALQDIRARYAAIREALAEASKRQPESDPEPEIPALDMSQFDVKESQFRPPVVVAGAESDRRERVSRNVLILRTVVAGTLLVVLVAILVKISDRSLGFYAVPTRSMEPTLKPGDRLVAYADSFYLRGDIVVLRDPRSPEEFLVKRVIGLPGDRVEVRGARVYINEQRVEEPYIAESIQYRMPPLLVGEREIFVLGDNRNNSEDGHVWRRSVPVDSIMGRVRYIYSPATRRGAPESYAHIFDRVP